MTSDAEGLCLIKPQFEAGPEENEQGIVTDTDIIRRVLDDVIDRWYESNWGTRALAPAPLTGQEGNQEFVAVFSRRSETRPAREHITRVVEQNVEWGTSDFPCETMNDGAET